MFDDMCELAKCRVDAAMPIIPLERGAIAASCCINRSMHALPSHKSLLLDSQITIIIDKTAVPKQQHCIMWTTDLFSAASPVQQPKQQGIFDVSTEIMNLSPSSGCSSRSESPVPVDPISPVSPRSIFSSYWSSSKSVDEEDELTRKLSKLQLPLVSVDDEASHPVVSDKVTEALPRKDVSTAPTSELPAVNDDTSISYRLPPAPDRSPNNRRQILPTPPSSFVRPKPSCTKACCRPWSSTSALIKKPSASCLRPTRYSLSRSVASLSDVAKAVDVSSENNKKGVSFYAQVSVFEFTVPQEQQKSDGWSKYFV